MNDTIKVKKGNKANLNNVGYTDGVLKYTKDTNEMFIGTGEENKRFNLPIIEVDSLPSTNKQKDVFYQVFEKYFILNETSEIISPGIYYTIANEDKCKISQLGLTYVRDISHLDFDFWEWKDVDNSVISKFRSENLIVPHPITEYVSGNNVIFSFSGRYNCGANITVEKDSVLWYWSNNRWERATNSAIYLKQFFQPDLDTRLNTTSKYVVGAINELETNKTDTTQVDDRINTKVLPMLDVYQTKVEQTLKTESKYITGAINELKDFNDSDYLSRVLEMVPFTDGELILNDGQTKSISYRNTGNQNQFFIMINSHPMLPGLYFLLTYNNQVVKVHAPEQDKLYYAWDKENYRLTIQATSYARIGLYRLKFQPGA